FDQAEVTLADLPRQTKNAGNAVLGGLLVRTHGNAKDVIDRVRRFVQAAMPGSAYLAATSMDDILAPRRRSWSLGATMFAIFGALALVLAAIGLYGVMACSVAERTGEIGVRIALGAQTRDVVGLVVAQGVRVVAAGVLAGIAVTLVAGRW